MSDRTILHCDANSFYASVCCTYYPQYRGKPLSVCGDPEARHGIVLASTREAKKRGVKVGMAVWQAKQVCPILVVMPPEYERYIHFSQHMRKIYEEFTDRVESFGLDEAWMDISNPGVTLQDGEHLAGRLRRRITDELGITISIKPQGRFRWISSLSSFPGSGPAVRQLNRRGLHYIPRWHQYEACCIVITRFLCLRVFISTNVPLDMKRDISFGKRLVKCDGSFSMPEKLGSI